MPILNQIFERGSSEDVTKSLGNVLISGVENEGSRKLYQHMLMDLLHQKKTIVLVNGALSRDAHQKIRKFISPHMVGRFATDLNLSGSGDSFDVLSAFQTSEQKADFVAELLSLVSEVPDLLKNKAQRFYLYAIDALDRKGEKRKLKDLSMLDPEAVTELVEGSSLPDLEKRRALRFLSDSSLYSSFLDIESCMVKLESTGLLETLSGDLSAKDLLADGNVVLVSGLLEDDHEKKEQLFNAVFYALLKCLEKYKTGSGAAFLIKDADFIAGDLIKSLLEYNASCPIASCIFADDITKYVEKNGNAILDACRSFLVFQQGSDENASFWSAFFGSREIQEKSYSYTKRKSWNPFDALTGGGVIASPRKYNTTTTNIQKVNKPIYPPEVFRELKPLEVMCYLREPLIRRKTRVED